MENLSSRICSEHLNNEEHLETACMVFNGPCWGYER